MSDEAMKPCAVCCELIPAAAKKCAHCHEWQSKWSRRWSSSLFRMGMILVVCLLVAFAFVLFESHMIGRSWSDKKDFAQVRQTLKVTNVQIVYSNEGKNGPTIAAIGTIKNESDIAWEELTYQVQYFNASNQLIDTTEDWQYRSILPPHEEAAFKVRGFAERPKEDYVTAKVFITSGKKLDQ